MNANKPLVSVIIPTYKRSENLLQTIESVLNQTYPNIEIIVVDDNGDGTDFQKETESRLTDYLSAGKITYIKHAANRGGSAARNTGFKASRGEYIIFLDDDDEMLPKMIEMQVDRLEHSGEKTGACYCWTRMTYIGSLGRRTKVTSFKKEGQICLDFLIKEPVNTSALMFKREAVAQLNGFDETFIRHQDYEMMTRFFTLYEITCCKGEPLLERNLTKVRTFKSSGENDYFIKEKFLGDREPHLRQLGIFEKIAHNFWFKDVMISFYSREPKYRSIAFKRCLSYGPLTPKELYLLFKAGVKRILGLI